MTMHISQMTAEDIGFAVSMTDLEGWGNTTADFERLIYFEPKGCFVARIDGRRAGMITTTTYGEYAFMGSLIVDANFRRQGIGEALMRHAMAYLDDKGIKGIELDGTFQGVPLYRKLGFKDKYLSLRLRRPSDNGQPAFSKAKDYSTEEILSFDRIMTGLDRDRILSRFIEEFPDSVYLSGKERLNGYGLISPRTGKTKAIGPVVAETEDIAERIIDEMIERNRAFDLTIGLPGIVSYDLVSFLIGHDFEYSAPSLRMYYGRKFDYESGVYAILSAAKG